LDYLAAVAGNLS